MPVALLLESVGWLWALLPCLLVAWAFATVGLFRMRRRLSPILLAKDQRGASYVLGFVLTVPLYFLLCCVIVEVCILLSTKVGTVYSAYAAARSAAVWTAANPASLREERVWQAAINGLAPFAMSGDEVGSAAGTPPSFSARHASQYVDALAKFSGASVERQKLVDHYQKVAARTDLDLKVASKTPQADVTVKIRYRAPFVVPGVGKLLSPTGGYPYEYPIESTVKLTLEFPSSDERTLGIDYRSY